MALATLALQAAGSSIQVDKDKAATVEVRISGAYQMNAAGEPPLRADFPIEVRAKDGHLLITALMPMEEYIAGVLAGETGNFKSDEALKAMAVAARTFAMHFGSRHALDGFDFCDTTHCQDLRVAGIDPHLRGIAQATAGEVLWYDGEPAATYYAANCGGTSEDGRFILGNDEARAPFLRQHSDQYCVRNGSTQWRSEVPKRELQRALAADGIVVPGTLRSVTVLHRTPSGRVEFLRVTGSGSVTVSALNFRAAIGHNIGWDRLKSNLYDVSDDGTHVMFHGRGSGHGVGLCQIGAEVMGEEGHSYREILAFYYPGTKLGVSAQGIPWQQISNEDVELFTTQPEYDRALLSVATRYMHESEESTGLVYRAAPRLKVYATVAAFRNSTGRAGMGRCLDARTHHPVAAIRRVAASGHAGQHHPSRTAAHADRVVRACRNSVVVSRRIGVVSRGSEAASKFRQQFRRCGGAGKSIARTRERRAIAGRLCRGARTAWRSWLNNMANRYCSIGCRTDCRQIWSRTGLLRAPAEGERPPSTVGRQHAVHPPALI